LRSLPILYAAKDVTFTIVDSEERMNGLTEDKVNRLGVFHTLSTKMNYSCEELELTMHLLLPESNFVVDSKEDFLEKLSMFQQLWDSCGCTVTDLCAGLMCIPTQPNDALFQRHIDNIFPTSDQYADRKIHLFLLPYYLRARKSSNDTELQQVLDDVIKALREQIDPSDASYPPRIPDCMDRSTQKELLNDKKRGLLFLKYNCNETVAVLLTNTGLLSEELSIVIDYVLDFKDGNDSDKVPALYNTIKLLYLSNNESASDNWIALLSSVGRWKKIFGLSLDDLDKLLFYACTSQEEGSVPKVINPHNYGMDFFLGAISYYTPETHFIPVSEKIVTLLTASKFQKCCKQNNWPLDDILLARCGLLSTAHLDKVAVLCNGLTESTFFQDEAKKMNLEKSPISSTVISSPLQILKPEVFENNLATLLDIDSNTVRAFLNGLESNMIRDLLHQQIKDGKTKTTDGSASNLIIFLFRFAATVKLLKLKRRAIDDVQRENLANLCSQLLDNLKSDKTSAETKSVPYDITNLNNKFLIESSHSENYLAVGYYFALVVSQTAGLQLQRALAILLEHLEPPQEGDKSDSLRNFLVSSQVSDILDKLAAQRLPDPDEIGVLTSSFFTYNATVDSDNFYLDIESIIHYKEAQSRFSIDKCDPLLMSLAFADKDDAEIFRKKMKIGMTEWNQIKTNVLGTAGKVSNLPEALSALHKISLIRKLRSIFCDDAQLVTTFLKKSLQSTDNRDANKRIADFLLQTLRGVDSAACDRIEQNMSEKKRDVLIKMTLKYFSLDDRFDCFRITSADKLSEYLLVDVSISGCDRITPVVHAHASLQWYLRRCVQGVEQDSIDGLTIDTSKIDPTWWEWLQNYRVWEANRKVFLYPENYLSPDLRPSQSEAFKTMMSTMKCAQYGNDTIAQSFLNYITEIMALADIKVIAICKEPSEANAAATKVHLIGQDSGNPPNIFHCTAQRANSTYSSWTFWEKLPFVVPSDATINANHAYGKLFLHWTIGRVLSQDSGKADEKSQDHLLLQCFCAYQKPNSTWEAPYTLRCSDWLTAVTITCKDRGNPALTQLENDLDNAKNAMKVLLGKFNRLSNKFRNPSSGGRGTPVRTTKEAVDDAKSLLAMAELDVKKKKEAFDAEKMKENNLYETLVLYTENEIPTIDLVSFGGTLVNGAVIENNQLVLSKAKNQYMSITPFATGKTGLTFALWFKADSQGRLFEFGNLDTINSDTIFCDLETVYFDTSIDKGLAIYLMGAFLVYIKNQKLYHMVLALDSSGVCILYLNGENVNNQKMQYPVSAVRSNNFLGKSLSGCIEDFRIYNKVLTAAEVQTLFTSKTVPLTYLINQSKEDSIFTIIITDGAFRREDVKFRWEEIVIMPFGQLTKETPTFISQEYVSPQSFPSNDDLQTLLQSATAKLLRGPCTKMFEANQSDLFDLRMDDLWGQYYWEVFFFLPLSIANSLQACRQHKMAKDWYSAVFDPSLNPPTKGKQQEYFLFAPLTGKVESPTLQSLINVELLKDFHSHAFEAHRMASQRGFLCYQKYVVMQYIRNIIAWGDTLFTANERESITEALGYYQEVNDLLGPAPRALYSTAYMTQSSTISVLFKNIIEYTNPQSNSNSSNISTAKTIVYPYNYAAVSYFQIPENQMFMDLWKDVADRLFKIRNCRDINGIYRQLALFSPTIDPDLLVRAVASKGGAFVREILDSIGAGSEGNKKPYRFQYLLQRAKELAGTVEKLGVGLILALERKDSAYLTSINNSFQVEVLDLMTSSKQSYINQCKNDNQQLTERMKQLDSQEIFYKATNGRYEVERLADGLKGTSYGLLAISQGCKVIGEWVNPAKAAAEGFAKGSVLAEASVYALEKAAVYLQRDFESDLLKETIASQRKELTLQQKLSELRLAVANTDMIIHLRSIRYQMEVATYNSNQFTNKDLYSWMADKLFELYGEAYAMAARAAKDAANAYKFELGTDPQFSTDSSWASSRKGLLAGTILTQRLNALNQSYLDNNKRTYEVTKMISLKEKILVRNTTTYTWKAVLIDSSPSTFTLSKDDFKDFNLIKGKRSIKTISLKVITIKLPPPPANPTSEPQFNLILTRGNEKVLITRESNISDTNPDKERYLPFEGLDLFEDGENLKVDGKRNSDTEWTLSVGAEDTTTFQDAYEQISDIEMTVTYTIRP
jgi:hypothetical protein